MVLLFGVFQPTVHTTLSVFSGLNRMSEKIVLLLLLGFRWNHQSSKEGGKKTHKSDGRLFFPLHALPFSQGIVSVTAVKGGLIILQ